MNLSKKELELCHLPSDSCVQTVPAPGMQRTVHRVRSSRGGILKRAAFCRWHLDGHSRSLDEGPAVCRSAFPWQLRESFSGSAASLRVCDVWEAEKALFRRERCALEMGHRWASAHGGAGETSTDGKSCPWVVPVLRWDACEHTQAFAEQVLSLLSFLLFIQSFMLRFWVHHLAQPARCAAAAAARGLPPCCQHRS